MKRLCSVLLCFLLIASMAISAYAVSAVPEPVMKATESVVRVLAEYSDGYATGSGFVIKSDKDETLIATNYHVVEGNPYSISVWLSEDETASATILAYTDQKDMCILKLAYPVSLKPLTFAENGAKQGEAVYAVGFPGAADYLSDKEAHTSADATITDGIVSAVREATVSGYGTSTKILQINAAINSGNSGGPLFNANGDVVGINTYGISDAQGIFGAIDVSELKSFMADYSVPVPNNGSDFSWLVLIAASGITICVVLALIVVMRKKKTKTLIKNEVKNTSLCEYMAAHPEGIGMNDAVAMLLPVALRLRDLHNNGSAHLQVSPNSISVGVNGAILADATSAESDRYASGYAAPEIYRGTSAGNLSDIYSFCAVLSYVASGKQPANSLSRTDSETEDDEFNQFDSVFAEIIKTGMTLDSADRFASMQDVIIKLSPYNVRPFVNTASAVESNVPEAMPVKKSRVSPKKIAVIVAAVLAVALLGTYFGCYIGAKTYAQNGDFAAADSLLFAAPITKLHDAKLVAYVDAGQLMADRKYGEARTAFAHLAGYLHADELVQETNYRQALQYADKNEFNKAVNILTALSKQNYGAAEEKIKEIQYRWAWALVDEKKYISALNKLNLIRGYSDVNEAITALTELMYLEGQNLYYDADYDGAKRLFTYISDYADSEKYITLINVRTYFYRTFKENVDKLVEIFYFEDAAEILLSRDSLAEAFLCGTWRGEGYYFTVKKEGVLRYSISYNLPYFNYGHYYRIEDGMMLLYPKENENNTKALFAFAAITPDCIEVFCYKNNQIYTLYRQ